MARKILLICGVVSSALYAGTDVVAAIAFPGYHSFTSRLISELMARGAPTERLVDPLFLAYGVLVMAFAAGVWLAARGRPWLRVAAGALFAYGAAGLAGPTLFEMSVRGTGSPRGDLPHIVLTGVLVVLTLIAIGFAAAALGRRFRVYSLLTVLVMIGFGALTGMAGARLAAGEPTPWFGLYERVDIGAMLIWIAALAVVLLREEPHARSGRARRKRRTSASALSPAAAGRT